MGCVSGMLGFFAGAFTLLALDAWWHGDRPGVTLALGLPALLFGAAALRAGFLAEGREA